MKGLYAIVDTKLLEARGVDPIAYARAILEVRPAAIQLRAKDVSAREILGMLRALGPLCRQANVPLVANDRADLAALAGCEFVHIGQEDLPYDLVHRIAPQLAVGISTHDPQQLERALAHKPRYVAYGPIYPRDQANTMSTLPPVGVEGFREASKSARAAGIPIVAIGGITSANANELRDLADACAVKSDLFPPGATLTEVTERARRMHAALGGTPRSVEARP